MNWIKSKISAEWIKARLIEKNTWNALLGGWGAYGTYLHSTFPKLGAALMLSAGFIWMLIHIIAQDTSTLLGKVTKAIEDAKQNPKL